MAVIPKYFVQRDGVPAISNAQIDPSTAAAPYRAAEQSTQHLLGIFQNELGAWGKVVAQKEAEQQAADRKNQQVQDNLYKAQAMADMTLGMQKIHQTALSKADGTTDVAAIGDQEFQAMADQILANAPSDNARLDLTKRLIGSRAQMLGTLNSQGIKLNNQRNMDSIEGMLSQYEAAASRDPSAVGVIKQNTEDLFASMESLGIPAPARDQIRRKFEHNIDFQAAFANAQADPAGMKAKLESGEFDHLGAEAFKKLSHTIDASYKATTKQAAESLKDIETRIMKGMPLPQDFEARAQLAAKLGLDNDLQDIQRLSQIAGMTSNMNYNQLVSTAEEVKQMAAKGEIPGDAKKVEKLIKYLDTNVKSLSTDPFLFAENKGSFTPFNHIEDFTKLTPDEAQQRQYRAMQIKEAYGVDAPALKQSEMKLFAKQFAAAPVEQQVNMLQTLQGLGQTTVKAALNHVDKHDGGLSQVVRVSMIDKDLAAQILAGRKIASETKTSLKKAEGETTFPGLVVDDPALRKEMLQAGYAYQLAAKAGGSEDDLETAVAKANNLVKVDRNGWFNGSYHTVAPGPNMTPGDMAAMVDKALINPSDWTKYASSMPNRTESGAPIRLNRVTGSDYDYVYNKDGSYGVYYEGEKVVDVDGKPLKVDLKTMYKDTHP